MKPKLIIRIVLGLVLAVVAVLALLDYQAKSKASATAEAWMAQIEETAMLSDLDQYIEGDPAIKTIPGSAKNIEIVQYTWAGIIRSYRVDVTVLPMGKDGEAVISEIEGPIND